MNDLQNFIDSTHHRIHVIVVSETWLKENDKPYFNFLNYNAFHSVRNNKIGGGVSIFIHNQFDTATISFESDANNNNMLVVSLNKNNFKIAAVYRQPNNENDPNCSQFLYQFECLVSKFSKMIILGDFNLNMFNRNDTTNKYENSFGLNGYALLNSTSYLFPTRVNIQNNKIVSSSCIDHILSDVHIGNQSLSYNLHYFDLIADHKSIFLNLSSKNWPKIKRNSYITFKLINHNRIMNQNLLKLLTPENFEQYISSIKEIIECNTRIIQKESYKKSYMTSEIKNYMNIRDNYLKMKQKFPNLSYATEKYKFYRNLVTKLIRQEKKETIDKYFTDNVNSPTKTWEMMKKLIYNKDPKEQTHCESLIDNGISITNPTNIANRFNSYFSSVAHELVNTINISNERLAQFHSQETYDVIFPFNDPICTEDEIDLIIRNMKNSPATDFYGISAKFVKLHRTHLVPNLTRLINDSLTNSIFPDCLQIGVISPIFKTGSKNDKANYRPISVLPIFSKVYEYVLLRRLEDHLSMNKIINNTQFGYTKKSNCEIAAIHILNKIYSSIDNRQATALTCIDLSRAFDTVPHDILLKKLKKMQISDRFYNILYTYFQNRKQVVRVGDHYSSINNVTRGTPQGGILSGIFFNIYMNSINKLHLHSNIFMYCDDISLTTSARNPEQLKIYLEEDLRMIAEWLDCHFLVANSNKTKYVLFHNRKYQEYFIINPLHIQFKNSIINRVESIRLLGLQIDENLNFHAHVNSIQAKIVPFLYALKRIRSFITEKTAMSMYFAYINSRFEYMICLWGTTPKYLMDSIEILQRKALRIVLKKNYLCSKNELYSEKIMPVSSCHRISSSILVFKMIHNIAINNNNLQYANQIHSHNTRHNQSFIIPRHNLQLTSNNFYIRALQFYNQLPSEIKNRRALSLFKADLKSYLFEMIKVRDYQLPQ
jgi:hypothetical protein